MPAKQKPARHVFRNDLPALMDMARDHDTVTRFINWLESEHPDALSAGFDYEKAAMAFATDSDHEKADLEALLDMVGGE